MCTRCAIIEPIHAGDGTPIQSFVMALGMCAERHSKCEPKAARK